MSFLSVAEQKKLDKITYVNVPKTNKKNITQVDISSFYKGVKKLSPGYRFRVLNWYFVQPPGGKSSEPRLDSDAFNEDTLKNLSDRAEELIKKTRDEKKENGFDTAASYFKEGMFTTLLVNIGTDNEPCWDLMDNIIINVSASKFTVKNKFETKTNEPQRIVFNVKNNNENEKVYTPFVSNTKTDNEMFCDITRMLQEDLAKVMDFMKQCHDSEREKDSVVPKDKRVKFLTNGSIPDVLLQSASLDMSATGHSSMYKRCRIDMKNSTPEAIPIEDPKDHFVQVRTGISGLATQKTLDDYNQWHSTAFERRGVYIAAPYNQINYRYIDTTLIGNENPNLAIMQCISMLSLHKSDFYQTGLSKFHTVHPYTRADTMMNGTKNPMFTQFTKCNNQFINCVVNFKCYVRAGGMTITADLVSFTPIYITRLDNKVFSYGSEQIEDDNFDDDNVVVKKKSGKPSLKYDDEEIPERNDPVEDDAEDTTTTTTTPQETVEEEDVPVVVPIKRRERRNAADDFK